MYICSEYKVLVLRQASKNASQWGPEAGEWRLEHLPKRVGDPTFEFKIGKLNIGTSLEASRNFNYWV